MINKQSAISNQLLITCNRSLPVMPEVFNRASSAFLDSPVKPGNDKCIERSRHYSWDVNKQEAGFTPHQQKAPSVKTRMKGRIFPKGVTLRPRILTHGAGFTLVEILITMVVFVLVIAAASQIFTGLLTQFKQQSKIAETNIEVMVGLDMLRRDIEHAGFGLPWGGLIAYNEAASAPESNFNESTTTSPPRAIVSGNDVTFFSGLNSIFNGTDYLVIKATNIARSGTAQRWTNLRAGNEKIDDLSGESFLNSDYVIVLSPTDDRSLITSGGAFSTTYNNTAGFAPSGSKVYVIYGVDPDTNLRMPFNRADFFIRRFNAAGNNITPERCAPNTGVLEKATVNQGNGALDFTPLLDCVADMQVVYRLDMDEDGTIGTSSNADGSSVTSTEGATSSTVQGTLTDASLLRRRLKEVRVYILAHEGQRDADYIYRNDITNPVITVGEFGLGRDFNFVTAGVTNWENYRWKVYTLVVKPNNLR